MTSTSISNASPRHAAPASHVDVKPKLNIARYHMIGLSINLMNFSAVTIFLARVVVTSIKTKRCTRKLPLSLSLSLSHAHARTHAHTHTHTHTHHIGDTPAFSPVLQFFGWGPAYEAVVWRSTHTRSIQTSRLTAWVRIAEAGCPQRQGSSDASR